MENVVRFDENSENGTSNYIILSVFAIRFGSVRFSSIDDSFEFPFSQKRIPKTKIKKFDNLPSDFPLGRRNSFSSCDGIEFDLIR